LDGRQNRGSSTPQDCPEKETAGIIGLPYVAGAREWAIRGW
jgi:hypothetical protein